MVAAVIITVLGLMPVMSIEVIVEMIVVMIALEFMVGAMVVVVVAKLKSNNEKHGKRRE